MASANVGAHQIRMFSLNGNVHCEDICDTAFTKNSGPLPHPLSSNIHILYSIGIYER